MERRLADLSSLLPKLFHSKQQRRKPVSLSRWTDGKCYELGTQGPCPGQQQFVVLHATMRPDCVRLSIELSLLPTNTPGNTTNFTSTTPGCMTNHEFKCEKNVEVSTEQNTVQQVLRENATKMNNKMKKETSMAARGTSPSTAAV